jgi:hypothetical protein
MLLTLSFIAKPTAHSPSRQKNQFITLAFASALRIARYAANAAVPAPTIRYGTSLGQLCQTKSIFSVKHYYDSFNSTAALK